MRGLVDKWCLSKKEQQYNQLHVLTTESSLNICRCCYMCMNSLCCHQVTVVVLEFCQMEEKLKGDCCINMLSSMCNYNLWYCVLPGSPWKIDIVSAANITASGNGLQLVPVNRPAHFEVKTGGYGHVGDAGIQVQVTCKSRLP